MKWLTAMIALMMALLNGWATSPAECLPSLSATENSCCCAPPPVSEPASCCETEPAPPASCSCHIDAPMQPMGSHEPITAPARHDVGTLVALPPQQTVCLRAPASASHRFTLVSERSPGHRPPLYMIDCSLLN